MIVLRRARTENGLDLKRKRINDFSNVLHTDVFFIEVDRIHEWGPFGPKIYNAGEETPSHPSNTLYVRTPQP